MFNRTGFKNGQKVYVVWMQKYGRITQIRGGLIRIDIINPKPAQPKQIFAKPNEIEKA